MEAEMKALLTLPMVLVLGCAAAAPAGMSDAAKSRLDRALAGRTAGQPQSCVQQRELRSSHVEGDTILYEGRGSVLYLNRTSGGCNSRAGRTLVTQNPIGNLCRGDIVRTVEPVSGTDWGSCTLGDFVPYRRVR
jgi:hypothetical protein